MVIQYNDTWIRENYFKYDSMRSLVMAYNHEFGTDVKLNTFKSHCNRELKYGGIRNEMILYTDEQLKWLKKHYSCEGNNCFDEFNRKFNCNRSKHALSACCKKHKFRVNKEVADKHHLSNTKREHVIGDVWKDNKTGFWLIKIANVERNQQESIKRYHRYIWEQSHGKIPPGHKVIFLDGNVDNVNIDNLLCVSASHLALMNKYDWRTDNPTITKVASKWCDLYLALKDGNKVMVT